MAENDDIRTEEQSREQKLSVALSGAQCSFGELMELFKAIHSGQADGGVLAGIGERLASRAFDEIEEANHG